MNLANESTILNHQSKKRLDLLEKQVKIREMINNDEAFIFHSWLTTFRTSDFTEGIRKTIYFKRHHKIVEDIISRSDILVACNYEDEDQVYGYIVFEEPDVIHWIYVKAPFRGLGVGEMLMRPFKDRNLFVSHLPNKQTKFCRECYELKIRNQYAKKLSKKINATYDPYLIWGKK